MLLALLGSLETNQKPYPPLEQHPLRRVDGQRCVLRHLLPESPAASPLALGFLSPCSRRCDDDHRGDRGGVVCDEAKVMIGNIFELLNKSPGAILFLSA